MVDGNIVGWFTSHGRRIPITEGESKGDAIKRAFGRDADKKESEIKANKEEATKRNEEKNTKYLPNINKVTHTQFVTDLDKARDTRPVQDKWRVDNTHTAQDFKERGCKCYTSRGGSTVAVDKDGDIISVCKAKGDTTTSGSALLRHAVRMGGRKLDSFYGNDRFYVKNGFQAVSWTPFNKAYAPDGWKESGSRGESVVFYKYVGVGKAKHIPLNKLPRFTGSNGYDNAMKYRDSH